MQHFTLILLPILLVFGLIENDDLQDEMNKEGLLKISQAIPTNRVETDTAANQSPPIGRVRTPLDGDVTITVIVTELANRCVRIYGLTNLPADTHLMLSVYENVSGGFHGQSKCSVSANGSFISEAFGPRGGLRDGVYVADIMMPLPSVQPAHVKKLLGENGERLSGPLVEEDFLGITVTVKKEFVIGGAQATQAQQERAEERIRAYDQWLRKLRTLYGRLQAARESNDTEYYWQEFAPQFRTELSGQQGQLEKVEPLIARLMIVSPLDAVRRMVYEEPFPMSKAYIEAKSDYVKSLEELEQFIAEAKSTQ